MLDLHQIVLYSLPVESVSMIIMVIEAKDAYAARAHCGGGVARHKRGIYDSYTLSVETPVGSACDT